MSAAPSESLDAAVKAARSDVKALLVSLTAALSGVSRAPPQTPTADAAAAPDAAAIAASLTAVRASVTSALAARDARDLAAAAAETADTLDGVHAGLLDRRDALRATVRDENQVVAQLVDEMRRFIRDVSICGGLGKVKGKDDETEKVSAENAMEE